MKALKEVVGCVWDAGTFPEIAVELAKEFAKVYYHTPFEREYLDVNECVIGDGLPTVERLDEPMAPEAVAEIDFYVFPDRGFGGHQRYLKSIGKAVWGSLGACQYELYRTRFYKLIEKLGLPMAKTVPIQGVTALADYLKEHKRKWIKVNRYRANMETWFHLDYEHSLAQLQYLWTVFGGVAEKVWFVVQDEIPDAQEIGYDGWCIRGQYPPESFQGYEAKNELYLGCAKKYEELPEPVRYVNEKFAPVLEQFGYTNFWATEIRLKDGVPYFIDPTPRMPGQTGEQLLKTCSNLAEVMWKGAHGEVVTPEFEHKFAVEATLHYTGDTGDDGWKVMRVTPEAADWFKAYQFCMVDGLYKFPPGKNDEVGVVIGVGQSIEDAMDSLNEHIELLGDEPVKAHLDGFVDLIEQVEQAEAEGMEFSKEPLPDAAKVVADLV